MLVRDVMNRKVIVVGPKTPLKEAIDVMNKNHIGSLVILENERIVGIMTERDVLRAVAEGIDIDSTPVEKIMTRDVITVSPVDTLEDAVELMSKHKIKKLPVVDGEKLVGIITASDIIVIQPKLIENLANLLSIRVVGYKGG